MIVTKTPLRISLFGGGTDYPAFCDREGGMVLGGTIDKYVYITASKLFPYSHENIRLSYRDTESVCELDELKHPIVREYLKKVNFSQKFAFYTVSDIPGRSGLGSSSAFSVGFIKLIQSILDFEMDSEWLAREAINLERNILKEPVGLQDQYHAAFGGFSKYEFGKDNKVTIQSIPNLKQINNLFSLHSVLIFTGQLRSAKSVLEEQVTNTASMTKDTYLYKMKEICGEAVRLFENGITGESFIEIGNLLRESWTLKAKLADSIANENINYLLSELDLLGAYGAKVLGAGGGGFILAIGDSKIKDRVRKRFGPERIVNFNFVPRGCLLV